MITYVLFIEDCLLSSAQLGVRDNFSLTLPCSALTYMISCFKLSTFLTRVTAEQIICSHFLQDFALCKLLVIETKEIKYFVFITYKNEKQKLRSK